MKILEVTSIVNEKKIFTSRNIIVKFQNIKDKTIIHKNSMGQSGGWKEPVPTEKWESEWVKLLKRSPRCQRMVNQCLKSYEENTKISCISKH